MFGLCPLQQVTTFLEQTQQDVSDFKLEVNILQAALCEGAAFTFCFEFCPSFCEAGLLFQRIRVVLHNTSLIE